MWNSVLGVISADLAIDLGSSTTRIFASGRGVALIEPSIVAIAEDRHGRRRILAVGSDALRMEGRTPRDIEVIRPIQDGSVANFEVLEAMLRHLMVAVQGRRLWVGPRAVIAVPYGTTEVERRAVRESAEASGAREVMLVEQPLVAAMGAGLPTDEARGHMILDAGAGTSTVSVISLGGVVYSRTIKVGGEHMDLAIQQHVAERHGIAISRAMAEEARIAIGSCFPNEARSTHLIRGRHIATGYPRAAELESTEVHTAMQEPINLIGEALLATLERTPPDLAADIADTGVVLVGGLANLPGIDRALCDRAGLPIIVAEEPTLAVVHGAAMMVGSPAEARRSA